MERSDKGQREPASSRSLRDAIQQARLEEAESLDRAADGRSSELARLEVLKAGLERYFEEIPEEEGERFELALVPSSPARLWIDMFAYVAVDPASHVYRLVRNGRHGRRVLVETRDVAEMGERVVDYVARQIVARERALNGLAELARGPLQPAPAPAPPEGRAGIAVAAFLIGLLTGIAGLFAAAYLISW